MFSPCFAISESLRSKVSFFLLAPHLTFPWLGAVHRALTLRTTSQSILSIQDVVFYNACKHSSKYNNILPDFQKLFISLSKLHSFNSAASFPLQQWLVSDPTILIPRYLSIHLIALLFKTCECIKSLGAGRWYITALHA